MLVCGPGVGICDGCTTLAMDICGEVAAGREDRFRDFMRMAANVLGGVASALVHVPRCPWCRSEEIDAEFVDIGVGMQQVTPYVCGECGAYQFGCGVQESDVTPEEWFVKWFGPQDGRDLLEG